MGLRVEKASRADWPLGQIQASLTSLSRTIDDYAETAKKELVVAKQQKAQERIKNFKGELADYRQTLERLKNAREDVVRDIVQECRETPQCPYGDCQMEPRADTIL